MRCSTRVMILVGKAGLEEALYQPLFTSPIAFNRTAREFGTRFNVEDENKHGETPVFAGGTDGFAGELYFEANDDLTVGGRSIAACGWMRRVKTEIVAAKQVMIFFMGLLVAGRVLWMCCRMVKSL